MRQVPVELAEHLAGGATTMCTCWRVTPRGRAPLGFTDHDCDLVFEGTVFLARTGLAASEWESSSGLAAASGDVVGALDSDALEERAIAAGWFDAASVEIWRVNWNDPSQRILMERAEIGEIRRGDTAFTAELRGLETSLSRPSGRIYQASCDADFGDARCGMDRDSAAHHVVTHVTKSGPGRCVEAGISGVGEGHFTAGRLKVLSGTNSGFTTSIARHLLRDAVSQIELWSAPAAPFTAGDLIRLETGCDKLLSTCRDRYGNVLNFRGFPHMPGNDFVTSYPTTQDLTSA